MMMVVTTLLALLYGLGWHNQPANERRSEKRTRR